MHVAFKIFGTKHNNASADDNKWVEHGTKTYHQCDGHVVLSNHIIANKKWIVFLKQKNRDM